MAEIDEDYDPTAEKRDVYGWGQRLFSALDEKNITQTQLARALLIRHSGVTKWKQDTPPSARSLLRTAQLLNVSPYWLLFGEGPREGMPPALEGWHYPEKVEGKSPVLVAPEILQSYGIAPKHFGCHIANDPAFRNTYKPGSILILNCDLSLDPHGWAWVIKFEGRTLIRRLFIPPRDKGMILEVEDKDPTQRIVFSQDEWMASVACGDVALIGKIEACWGKE